MTWSGPVEWLERWVETRGFGDLSFPQYGSHTGIDLALPLLTPVVALRGGVVTLDDDSPHGPEGISVRIRYEDGATGWYAHLLGNGVDDGERVVAGQVIGASGTSGASTGPHLHYEVRLANGDLVDPRRYHENGGTDEMTEAQLAALLAKFDAQTDAIAIYLARQQRGIDVVQGDGSPRLGIDPAPEVMEMRKKGGG